MDWTPEMKSAAIADAQKVCDQAKRIAELEAALRSVMIGGNHVALLIGVPHPPHTATHDEARSFYSMQEQYEAWCCWRTIMQARDVLEKS